jgi:hypothetical protein
MSKTTWARHADLQALVAAVDEVAIACERKWGIGQLELLVDAELRDRFRRQQDKFNAAITSQDLAAVEKHAVAMRRGWEMLDRAAAHRQGTGRLQ